MFKLVTALFASIFLFAACAQQVSPPASSSADQPASQSAIRAGLANPASVNCSRQGGTLQIVDTGNGQIGLCHFPNGQSCEEWALLRGECAIDQK
jgi:uncharacterized protein